MPRQRPLTREQLRRFLPDHLSIKVFEQIMDSTYEVLPDEDNANDASALVAYHSAMTAYSEAQRARSAGVLAWLSM